MSMTHQQFSYLQEMGISLWQRKEILEEDAQVKSTTSTPNLTSITLEQLLTTQLFKDILVHLGFEATELAVNHNVLSIGLFSWSFSNEEDLFFEHNMLKTPSLSELSKSNTSKALLMKIFEQHNLFNISE